MGDTVIRYTIAIPGQSRTVLYDTYDEAAKALDEADIYRVELEVGPEGKVVAKERLSPA